MSDTKTRSEDAVDEAVTAARNLKDEAKSTIETYKNEAARLQEELYSNIQEKPLRTLGVAAMIGFALGAIWKL